MTAPTHGFAEKPRWLVWQTQNTIWLLGFLLLAGCGGPGHSLVPVSGQITLAGKPLPKAQGDCRNCAELVPAYGQHQNQIAARGLFRPATDDIIARPSAAKRPLR